MSRTQENSVLASPVKERYFINGRDGTFSFLSADDQNATFQNVDFPFHFILLDSQGFRAKGEHDKRKVKSTPGHFKYFPEIKLFYDDNGKELARGKWQQLKEMPGIRFVSVITAAKPDGTVIELHLKGMAYAEFLKFVAASGADRTDPAFYFRNDFFTITGLKQVPTDFNPAWVPELKVSKISKKETGEMADKLDQELQAYFQEYAESRDLNTEETEPAKPANDPGDFPTAKDERRFEEDFDPPAGPGGDEPTEETEDDLPF